jgi:hypothetical protein
MPADKGEAWLKHSVEDWSISCLSCMRAKLFERRVINGDNTYAIR